MYDLSLQVLLVIVTVFYRKCQWTLATRDLQGFLYMDNLKETQNIELGLQTADKFKLI